MVRGQGCWIGVELAFELVLYYSYQPEVEVGLS